MENTWEKLIDKKIKELSDYLVRTFKDESTVHRFSINQVNPFMYRTIPFTVDYRLFIDIERTNRESSKMERFREVSLGSYCNSGPRKLIDFGEQYFDSTYNELIKIVMESRQESIDDSYSKTLWNLNKLKGV